MNNPSLTYLSKEISKAKEVLSEVETTEFHHILLMEAVNKANDSVTQNIAGNLRSSHRSAILSCEITTLLLGISRTMPKNQEVRDLWALAHSISQETLSLIVRT